MNALNVEIASLKPDPRNTRRHSARNIEAIRKSLERFGQQKPIVIDSANVIRAGNGTWAAARELGWTHIAVVVSDLSTADLKAFAIADNRTAELAEWDAAELTAQIEDLQAEGIIAADLMFDDAELDALFNSVSVTAGHEEAAAQSIGGSSENQNMPGEVWKVIVDCRDEEHQRELLERFEMDGLKCRAVVG